MDRVKDYASNQSRTFARPECRRVLELGCGNLVLAIDLNTSHVALARVLA